MVKLFEGRLQGLGHRRVGRGRDLPQLKLVLDRAAAGQGSGHRASGPPCDLPALWSEKLRRAASTGGSQPVWAEPSERDGPTDGLLPAEQAAGGRYVSQLF